MNLTIPSASTEPVRISLHQGGQSTVYRDPHRFRVVVAGRQWGKSLLARAQLVKWALSRRDQRFWYVAPDRQMAKDILWLDLKRLVHPTWLAGMPMETELRIRFSTGSEIQLMGADNPDALRGRKLGGVVLDEYADMQPEAWTEALEPSVGILQSPALFIGTPKSFNHFYDLFTLGQQPHAEWKSWQFKSVDNPFFNRAEIERARATKDPRTFRQEYEASFETVSGRAYYAFSRMDHVQPVTLERSVPVGIAFDFNIDPACAVIWQRVGQECRVWRGVFLRHMGGEATRAAAKAVKDLLVSVGWSGAVRIYGDATGRAQKTTGPSDHAVLRELFPGATWCVRTANPHVRDRVAAVNGRCRTDDGAMHLRIDPHPSCAPLIADLEQVTFKDNGELDQTSNPLLTHISSALGYAIEYEWPPRGGTVVAALPGLKL